MVLGYLTRNFAYGAGMAFGDVAFLWDAGLGPRFA
jgi:hypothetical protein